MGLPHTVHRAVRGRLVWVAVLAGVLLVGAFAGAAFSSGRQPVIVSLDAAEERLSVPAAGAGAALAPVVVYVREGCPHCADAKRYLDDLRKELPGLQVLVHDIIEDPAALDALQDLVEERGLTAVSVPVIVIGTSVLVGFADADSSGRQIRDALSGASVLAADDFYTCDTPEAHDEQSAFYREVRLPVLGAVSAARLGLPAFTIAMGAVDGFNPCAMWVLLFILSMLVNMRSRARMLLIAGVFVIVSGLVYYAFMAAWLNVFMVIGYSRTIQALLGGVALAIGLLNVKDFVRFGSGVSLSIPESRKPAIYRRARAVIRAENVLAALIAVSALAVMVNLVEFLCTAGLPAIYTQVLASQDLTPAQHYGYLALYILFYMIDDAIMVGIAVVTLSQTKLQERGGRILKLVSGAVMLGLGLVLLLKPEWMAALG